MSDSRKKAVTSKLQKIVEQRTLIDKATGEERVTNVVKFQTRDFNFQKIWVTHLLEALDAVGNQKIKVLMWLIANRNSENLVIATQNKIAEKTNCARQTVVTTLKALAEVDAIVQISPGVYQISPDLIFQGDGENRAQILLDYEAVAIPQKKAREDKKKNSLKVIK